MHRILKTGLTTLALALAALSAQAQAPHHPGHTPGVDARQAQQQARIAEGRASGQLTHREAVHLQRQQHHIARAEARAKADGVVTWQERRHLRALQREASRDIHAQRHDGQHRGHPYRPG